MNRKISNVVCFSIVFLGFILFNSSVRASQIYSNDFSDVTDQLTEWSNSPTTIAPNGQRFLGRISNGSTTLTVPIPNGTKSISLAFDFYAIDSWDGQGPIDGIDWFKVDILGGVTLFQETFNNNEGINPWGNQGQSFGGQGQPVATYPARTGAAALNTLGFQSGRVWGSRDTTYSLIFKFPYADSSISFRFSDLGLQGINDESWGLDNVVVTAPSSPVPLPPVFFLYSFGLASLIFNTQWLRGKKKT